MMHFLAGWIALGCGLLNLLGRKGTSGHKALGLLFVISIGLVCFDAFTRGRLADLVNPLTLLTVLSLALTIWALLPFIERLPGWAGRHAHRMQGAYIALGAAAANEILSVQTTHWAPGRDHPSVLMAATVTTLVGLGGWWLARRQQPEIQRVADRFERRPKPRYRSAKR